MHVFGLTGGIASGKSAVAAIFREEGVPVVDADQIARDVVMPGTPGLAEIVQTFGADVLLPDGALDRKALAAIVFNDTEKRDRLNAILHPRIGEASAEKLAALGAMGGELGCYDAALIVERGMADGFRPLVVVAAPRALQHQRLMARDKMTPEEADARLDAQAPVERKLAAADVTIWNDADLETLALRAREALANVRARIINR